MNLLIIFAKLPRAGKVKTRLGTEIGMDAASKLYEQFIRFLFKRLSGSNVADKIVFAVSPRSQLAEFARAFPGANAYIPQYESANLGLRMQQAFSWGFTHGANKVVIIGSDSPNLPLNRIRQAFQALEQNQVVLGPADDGGYYLIGADAVYPRIFENIPWSTSQVLTKTLHTLQSNGLAYELLEPFYDVDDLEGLKRLKQQSPQFFAEPGVLATFIEDEPAMDEIKVTAANTKRVVVLIPALNEEKSIGKVLQALPRNSQIIPIVADNGSSDDTARVARENGARVVFEPRRGYGWACLAAMQEAEKCHPDIAVFLDADFSDYPQEIDKLIEPILANRADLVIGSRVLGKSDPGALLPQARFGNWLASFLISLFWRFKYTDLGPFRAIRWEALKALQMEDKTYGWTVEMQIKALIMGLRVTEIPVSYRKRIGKSKVTGTFSGTVKAGAKILWTIFKFGVIKRRASLDKQGLKWLTSSLFLQGQKF